MPETLDYISNKVSKVIGVMYRLTHIYPEALLLIIYQSIINALLLIAF